MTSQLQVVVVYSLPSKRMLSTEYGETDSDSEIIAKTVVRGLLARGMRATLFPVREDNISDIANIKADCIFNLIEWCGQDIALSKKAFTYLRKTGIPVTGSDEKMFVLTGDKIRVKQELIKLGVPCPKSMVFKTGQDEIRGDLEYPVIVKPSLEHCSMGLSYDAIAHNKVELRQIAVRQIKNFHQSALAEEFIVGRELLVYLLEEQGDVRVLPIEEIVFYGKQELKFQTYETKWREESEDYNSTDVVRAKLGKDEKSEIEMICKKTFIQMGLRGYARFDVRLRNGIPYILETNANPSVYDATDELENVEDEVIWGIKFCDYLEMIVKMAMTNYQRGWRV